MAGTPRTLSEGARLWTLLVVSAALSVGGVVTAVCCTHDPLDGGRGGALAVALTLAAFFLRKDVSSEMRTAITVKLPQLQQQIEQLGHPAGTENRPPSLQDQVGTLKRLLGSIAAEQRVARNSEQRIERFVAASAVIGTLAWGFGDLVAGWLL